MMKEFNNPNNYFKIDRFIKNPAPWNVPLIEVMKKIGSLFAVGF